MKNLMSLLVLIAFANHSYSEDWSGIYVEVYRTTAGDHAPDGWQAVPGFPCRHGIDANNDGFLDDPDNPGPCEPGLPSGSAINLTNVNGALTYRIWSATSNFDIGAVTVSGSNDATIIIGNAFDDQVSPTFNGGPGGAAGRNLASFSHSQSRVQLYGKINGTLTGDIDAWHIAHFRFGGIQGNVNHNKLQDPSAPAMGFIFAGSVSSGANIVSGASNLLYIQVFGEFAGTVRTRQNAYVSSCIFGKMTDGHLDIDGDLYSLDVFGDASGLIEVGGRLEDGIIRGNWGVDGSGFHPSAINVGESIDEFDVGDAILGGTSGGDYVGSLTADSIGRFWASGAIYGYDNSIGSPVPASINIARDITEFAVIGYPPIPGVSGNYLDFEANTLAGTDPAIFLGKDFLAGSVTLRDGLPDGSRLQIGGQLASGVTIDLANDPLDPNDVGLAGELMINWDNDGDAWDGDVVVGTTTLDENYTLLSSEFGGGTAGRVGVNFHQRETAPGSGEVRECSPYQKEAVSLAPLDLLREVTISHYGPVFVVDGPDPQFRVQFLSSGISIGGGPQWVDRTALFEVDTALTATDEFTAHRDIVIKAKDTNLPGFKAAGVWRIRPINEGVAPLVKSKHG